MSLSDLPTLAEMRAVPRACPKGKSRLEQTGAEKRLTVIDEKAFRTSVIDRDGAICRCCGRKVVRTLARVPERLEVHHVHGRRGDLRFESRAALVLCLECHEKVTGRVNFRLVIVATKTFQFQGRELTDARRPVRFERAA